MTMTECGPGDAMRSVEEIAERRDELQNQIEQPWDWVDTGPLGGKELDPQAAVRKTADKARVTELNWVLGDDVA